MLALRQGLFLRLRSCLDSDVVLEVIFFLMDFEVSVCGHREQVFQSQGRGASEDIRGHKRNFSVCSSSGKSTYFGANQ